MMSDDVNIILLNEQDSHISLLHLTVFATNNHYLSKVFHPLYQYFK
jgi:hypothetical protein